MQFRAENRRNRRVKVAGFEYLFTLGETTQDDGTRVIATERFVVFIRSGVVVDEKPNDLRIVPTFRSAPGPDVQTRPRPKRTRAHPDDGVVATWKEQRASTPHIAAEADRVWNLFKSISEDRPLRECNRDDGRKLVKALFDQGKKRATVQKLVGHLNAAVNIAIDEGRLSFNPFSRIMPKKQKGDERRRVPLTEDDMALIRKALPAFEAAERALWVVIATTGMRRGEVWETVVVHREVAETVTDYWIVGAKTDSSERRVPIPDAVRPYLSDLPALYGEKPINLGKRLLRRICNLGI